MLAFFIAPITESHQQFATFLAIRAIKFIDRPEFDTEYEGEKVVLPFRCLADDEGNPIVTDGIVDILTQDLDWDLSELS